ncbi:hypothetical protein HII31_05115 [Pseudocercospora fuligena]|uniref:Uncharacterized protein n=1 Tax=Pseudocercospora fuligena TaxID=685502 RepID=A0A8H6VJ51_9PEZI|nr:hypothetical protein HII31_05115 [Pseudocercospora fuligena]
MHTCCPSLPNQSISAQLTIVTLPFTILAIHHPACGSKHPYSESSGARSHTDSAVAFQYLHEPSTSRRTTKAVLIVHSLGSHHMELDMELFEVWCSHAFACVEECCRSLANKALLWFCVWSFCCCCVWFLFVFDCGVSFWCSGCCCCVLMDWEKTFWSRAFIDSAIHCEELRRRGGDFA